MMLYKLTTAIEWGQNIGSMLVPGVNEAQQSGKVHVPEQGMVYKTERP